MKKQTILFFDDFLKEIPPFSPPKSTVRKHLIVLELRQDAGKEEFRCR